MGRSCGRVFASSSGRPPASNLPVGPLVVLAGQRAGQQRRDLWIVGDTFPETTHVLLAKLCSQVTGWQVQERTYRLPQARSWIAGQRLVAQNRRSCGQSRM